MGLGIEWDFMRNAPLKASGKLDPNFFKKKNKTLNFI